MPQYPARVSNAQQVHFLRKDVTFADVGNVVVVGAIPARSQILNLISGVFVTTVFGGTTPVLDVGSQLSSSTGDLYATNLSLGTAAFVAIDEAATATNVNTWYVSVDTVITASVALTSGTATVGQGQIVIAYVPTDR
jgi:hypothetical protein